MEQAQLDYATPAPPPLPMSRSCCLAFTWVVVTFPLLTFFLVSWLMQRGGALSLFLWRNVWLRDLIYLGLPLIGIFIAIKGITDIDKHRDRDGRRLGIMAIWIGVVSLLAGAAIVKG